jgi:NAD(P)-dependent dehydrogenase (short-subunit alcohol dehydrogenase family)
MATIMSPIERLRPEEIRRVTEVTYLGTVHGTLAALKRMRPRNRGTIVQVGSALAYRAIPLQAPYCAAKFAIRGFTDALRCELEHDQSKVHVTMVQMPALNTPQFDWCRTHMPRQPQPVPPIFAPEVGARAIVWAARHRRREVYVGWPSVRAIWAQKLAPGFADRFLARTGYESQMAAEPVGADRKDNLWETVPGDHGAEGRFGLRALYGSRELQISLHRTGLAVMAVAVAALAATVWWKLRRRSAQALP